MSYLRWSVSNWYIFAHVDGGLAVWHVRDDTQPIFSNEVVAEIVAGKLPPVLQELELDDNDCEELLDCCRCYLAEEEW